MSVRCIYERMKKTIFLILLVTLTFSIIYDTHVLAQEEGKNYIVKLNLNDDIRLISADIEKIPHTNNFYLVDEIEAERLKESGLVEYIAEDYDVELFDAPNDTYYSQQWSLTEWGYEDVYERGLSG